MTKSRKVLASMAQERGMVLVQLVIDLPGRAYAKKGVEPHEAETVDILMWAVPRVDEQITLEDGRTLKVKGVRHSIAKGAECVTIVRVG